MFSPKARGTDDLTLLHDWPVSTGRETMERDNNGVLTSTATPVGYYQLDPKRFYRKYTSSQWGKPMPNSMFFDWMVRGIRRASPFTACRIRRKSLPLAHARAGGAFISRRKRPRTCSISFYVTTGAWCRVLPTTETPKSVSNTGKLARDESGGLRMFAGYKALVVIENYGGQDLMSELQYGLERQRRLSRQ